MTTDLWAVVEDPRVEVVVEVMGGMEPAATLTARALKLGKPVVTANKLVLGAESPALRALADAQGTPLLFEAAVAGAVPVIRGLSGLRRSDEIVKVEGLLNGTTTFVLSHRERHARWALPRPTPAATSMVAPRPTSWRLLATAVKGQGDGGDATACSVIADLVEARNWVTGGRCDGRTSERAALSTAAHAPRDHVPVGSGLEPQAAVNAIIT